MTFWQPSFSHATMPLYFQLSDKYREFVTDPEREGFTAKLQETEDWLYEDGEDETKGVYIAKLEELKKVRTSICLRESVSTSPCPVKKGLVVAQVHV